MDWNVIFHLIHCVYEVSISECPNCKLAAIVLNRYYLLKLLIIAYRTYSIKVSVKAKALLFIYHELTSLWCIYKIKNLSIGKSENDI